MSTPARLIASILVAGSLLAACGDDDEATTSSGDGGAAVPAAGTAFDGLKTALEGQGLTVANLPATSLNGAETGVDITGDKTGTARLFSSSAKAEAYAKQGEKTGDATATVGTVVLQSASQEDADFFADAYEGG
jgi:hypothetical protein